MRWGGIRGMEYTIRLVFWEDHSVTGQECRGAAGSRYRKLGRQAVTDSQQMTSISASLIY